MSEELVAHATLSLVSKGPGLKPDVKLRKKVSSVTQIRSLDNLLYMTFLFTFLPS